MKKSFVKWLHGVAAEDKERKAPFADIYMIGPHIETVLGIEGEFDFDKLALYIRERYPLESERYLSSVMKAESAWRMASVSHTKTDLAVQEARVLEDCRHIGLDGRRCRNLPVPGGDRCEDHGGAIVDPSVRRAILLSAYAKMMDASDIAVETLVDVMENSKNALARVKAAQEVLDRVGLVHQDGAHQSNEEKTTESQDVLLEELRKHMDTAKERLQITTIDIVDADVIEDDE